MTLALAVVCEAPADFQTATKLADRVLIEAIEWLDPEFLAHQRTWLGECAGTPLTWKQIKHLARENHIQISGFFDGKPAEPDAFAARRAILLLRHKFPELNGVLLIRDQDDQPERRDGLEQARTQEDLPFPVVVGLAIVERENWVICGFDPQNEPETSRLEEQRQTLGFDPRLRSHELTACKNDLAKRSPKRVLRALSRDDQDREQLCWSQTPLNTLRERGTGNGLAIFLTEVHERIASLIGHIAEG